MISGMTKLLVGLGSSRIGPTNTFEIIDLESPLKTCKSLPNFSLELYGSFGGLEFEDKPIICGGRKGNRDSNKCFSLEGNEWIASSSLNKENVYAAVSPSPYPSSDQKLFVTGGMYQNTLHNTVEVLTRQGWKTLPQRLPVEIEAHCSVLVNSSTVMIIGGYQNGEKSSNTYLFNAENEIWTAGPELKTKRYLHTCVRIRKNGRSQDFSIIVAGGWNRSLTLSSVEILDLGGNEWRKGPDLPIGIDSAKMVEDPNGGVILVGVSSNSYRNTLYQLPHGGADAVWTKMEQKMKIGRLNHVAFLVPDDVVDCS
jgi:hypothetical protein